MKRSPTEDRSGRCGAGSRLRGRAPAEGFTLLELMVALAVGTIAIATAYTLGAASSEQFRSQQRISNVQTALRNAMSQIKRDVERAGYHATANSALPGEMCMTTNQTMVTMGSVVPIALVDTANNSGDLALIDRVTGDFTGVELQADRLTMIGNYASRDEYTVAGLTSGTRLVLESGNQPFRRSFTDWWLASPTLQADAVSDMFPSGRLMRLQNQQGYKFFVRISSSGESMTTPGLAEVNFGNDTLPIGSSCVGGMMTGAKAAPLSVIRYRLDADAGTDSAAGTRSEAVAGPNVRLIREEIDPITSATVGTPSTVLDYAVSFDVDFVIDDRADGSTDTTSLTPLDDGAAGPNGHSVATHPERVRAVVVTLAARTPEMDPRYEWFPITENGDIRSYRFNNTQQGWARVRTLHAEIPVSSVAYEGF